MNISIESGVAQLPGFQLKIPHVSISDGLHLVLGLNGSGKTVFLRTMLGLVPLSQGRRDYPQRSKLGYLPQSYRDALFPWLSAGLNLDTQCSLPDKARKDLKRLGFSKRDFRKKPYQLSGGQAQRLALVKELNLGADFLFIDEPYSSIDQSSLDSVSSLLLESLDSGCTIMLTTHLNLSDQLGKLVKKTYEVSRIADDAACVCES